MRRKPLQHGLSRDRMASVDTGRYVRETVSILATLTPKSFALADVTTGALALGREIAGPDYI